MFKKIIKSLFLVSFISLLAISFTTFNSASAKSHMRTPIKWNKSSETKPYPGDLNKMKQTKNLNVKVSLAKQRVYIRSGNKTLYTMYASTGAKKYGGTPKGNFNIQEYHHTYFYAPEEKEGAFYASSFKDNGIYLFHSVPVNQDKKVIKSVVKQQGKKPSSHGCIHLNMPDAKWFFYNIPVGTKVSIR